MKILFPGSPILEETSGNSQVWVVYNFIYLLLSILIFSLYLFVVILIFNTENALLDDICVFLKSSSTQPKCLFKVQ